MTDKQALITGGIVFGLCGLAVACWGGTLADLQFLSPSPIANRLIGALITGGGLVLVFKAL